mgnify:CR=1 FL=1
MEQAQPISNADEEQNAVMAENEAEQSPPFSLTQPDKMPQIHFNRDIYLGLGLAVAFILFCVIGSSIYPMYARETYLVPTMILVVALVLVMVFYQVNAIDDR